MLFEIDIFPAAQQPDVHAKTVINDAHDLGLCGTLSVKTGYGYLVDTGVADADGVQEKIAEIAKELLADAVAERFDILNPMLETGAKQEALYVLPKPGVTDSVAENAKKIIAEFGLPTDNIRTFKKYWITGINENETNLLVNKLLVNDAVEEAVRQIKPVAAIRDKADIKVITVPIRDMDDAALQRLSKDGQLYLSLTEMQTIKTAFETLKRDPTDIELETVAQTWSEHCSHKTLAGRIHYTRHNADGTKYERQFKNMLKETIFTATQRMMDDSGYGSSAAALCVSVFADNAGVVKFDDDYNVCFKVETHNHPSALEPYGGANTGLGGVIRDPMGTGLGAKPIASTDVFCFAPPDIKIGELPPGVLHPRRIMKGVVSGVRDYGNRMGIPTVNGAVYFDKRYLGNPLVFCGNIGILPKDKSFKEPQPNDLIVAVGGRTGRDGIHGATFSSAELTSESETLSGGAVQIGNAITEKMVLDVMLQARDKGLYTAVTDCGAGGFSSAVGEMAEKIGAEVELSNAPLKYAGLSYTEIWISEAQERMVFSVPPKNWDAFRQLCEDEDVEAVVLGTFKPTGKLVLKYRGRQVGNLDLNWLHNGRPPVVREAVYVQWRGTNTSGVTVTAKPFDRLLQCLSSLNTASKHWIIRQYDHEVQGGSVVKPLVGVNNDGPGDAAVVRPRLDSNRGLVISCGLNPSLGDVDPYQMAASAIDEAVRNAVAVGADPNTIVLLDNFCWGNTDRPETLGSLVEAALACYDVSLGFGMPFISGKDSLNNEFHSGKETISIPPTLLISAMGQIEDAAKSVTMDIKAPGNVLYLLGAAKPVLDVPKAKRLYEKLHGAIMHSVIRSVHDLSEGGLAVTVAEMCFAGGYGAELHGDFDENMLFAEVNSSFVIEVESKNSSAVESHFAGMPLRKLGKVTDNKTLRFGNVLEANIDELKAAWLKPLNW